MQSANEGHSQLLWWVLEGRVEAWAGLPGTVAFHTY